MLKKLIIPFLLLCTIEYASPNSSEIRFPDIKGWKLKIENRIYTSKDLWQLIDGAADAFLSYGFIDLHIAEYNKGNQIIRVEIYNQGTIENAYGMFTSERMPDYPVVQVGTLGYKSQGVLIFLTGIYYVKIMSEGSLEADENSIAAIAEIINNQLNQSIPLPDVISLFPEEGKIPLSDTYIANNFLGYSFLGSAFTAKYYKDGNFQIFIIRQSAEEIQKIFDQYVGMMKEERVVKKENIFIVQDLFNGTVFLAKKDGYLVGVVGTNNEILAKEYAEQIMNKLP